MKYQVRIKEIMSDKPASKLFDTLVEANETLESVRADIRENWAIPDVEAAYIQIYR